MSMMDDFHAKIRALNAEGQHGASLARWSDVMEQDAIFQAMREANKHALTEEQFFAKRAKKEQP